MEEAHSNAAIMQGDAGMLDVLLTLAENIKLLIIGPLIVGLCALGIAFMLPRTYQSSAIVQADQSVVSLMASAAVLDPVAASLGLGKDTTVDKARSKLREQIKVVVGRSDKLLTLTASARTAQQAQDIAHAVLQQTYQESRPKGTVRARLQTQLDEAQARLKNAQGAAAGLLQRLEAGASGGNGAVDVARGYAELLNATGAAQTEISTLEAQLEGLSDSLLLQPPNLPDEPSQPKKGLIAIGATLAAGLALLLFVFMRQAFRNMAQDLATSQKLARIHRCLGLK